MEQLKMVRDNAEVDAIRLPEGYTMRSYKKGDGQGWCKCCIDGSLGVDEISEDLFKTKMLNDEHVRPVNIFFLISPTNEIAGTVTYQFSDEPETGVIHMVGIQKDYLGKRLSLPMLLYAVQKILADGNKRMYLTTDDWRLPAIKTYLNAGFKPVFHHHDMEGRWKLVAEKLASKKALP